MNSMQYLNMSHLQSIQKVNRLSREQKQTKRVYTFKICEMGQLVLEHSGERKVRCQSGPASQAELVGKKRQRDEVLALDEAEEKKVQPEERQMIDTSAFEDQDETMEAHTAADDVDIQERILSQMLARRRRDEEQGHVGLYEERDSYSDEKSRPFLGELM